MQVRDSQWLYQEVMRGSNSKIWRGSIVMYRRGLDLQSVKGMTKIFPTSTKC